MALLRFTSNKLPFAWRNESNMTSACTCACWCKVYSLTAIFYPYCSDLHTRLSYCTCSVSLLRLFVLVPCRLQHHAQHRRCQTSRPRPLPTSCGRLPSLHTAQALSCLTLCPRMCTAAWMTSALSTLPSPCGLLGSWKHHPVLFCCRSVSNCGRSENCFVHLMSGSQKANCVSAAEPFAFCLDASEAEQL